MRIRHLVIFLEQAQAVMVWGQPLVAVFHRMLGLARPVGHILTLENLSQRSASQDNAFFETPTRLRPEDHHAHHPHC